jgi:hypothetical protein
MLLVLALAACSSPGREAARAVREYDDEIVRAYRSGDASRMTRVAAAKEAERVQVLIDLKSASKLVLESTLEQLEVTGVHAPLGAGAAKVETKERWRYFDRHLRPGEAPGPTFESDMAMRYDLVWEDGRWKVRDVSTLSNEYLGPAPEARAGAGHGAGHASGAPR